MNITYPLFDPGPGWPSSHLGFTILQNRLAVPAWSYLAERHPPKTIIEIGTYEGGFSCLMAILALNIGARFMTFDVGEPNPRWTEWFKRLNIDFRRQDVFSPEGQAVIRDTIANGGETWVLCDGGNKAREVQMIIPWLKMGDVIGGHDFSLGPLYWGSTEVYEGDFGLTGSNHGLRQYYREMFMPAAWLVYKKVADRI